MGRKINPIGFRLSVRRDWKSRWFAKGVNFTEMVKKDYAARRHIEKNYAQAAISFVEIQRTMHNVRVVVHSADPEWLSVKKAKVLTECAPNYERYFRWPIYS